MRYDAVDIAGIYACLSLLLVLGLYRLGLFLAGKLRPRWPRVTEQHETYFTTAHRRVPEE